MAIAMKAYKVCAVSGETVLPHTMSGDKETLRQRKKQIKASMTAVKTKTKSAKSAETKTAVKSEKSETKKTK